MKVIRIESSGKPQRIICTGCGKKASEAGVAFNPEDAEEGWRGAWAIEGEYTHPLCEECVTALLRNEEMTP